MPGAPHCAGSFLITFPSSHPWARSLSVRLTLGWRVGACCQEGQALLEDRCPLELLTWGLLGTISTPGTHVALVSLVHCTRLSRVPRLHA